MPYTEVTIDISHHNGSPNLANAQQVRVRAIIHKATQGSSFVDPMHQLHFGQVLGLRMLWGAYHLGNGDDGVSQAEFFLNTVKPGPQTLLVLDLESNTAGSTMLRQEGKDSVSHLHAVTRVWPGLYDSSCLKEQLGTQVGSILQNCGCG
jgi:lysozyme